MANFVNLHSHTCHSHGDAIIKIPDLFKRVVELGQPGVAITDHGVLAGLHEGYKEYKKYKAAGNQLKFIPGSEIYFSDDLTNPKSKRRHLIVLAQNEEGYRNLLRINALGYQNSVPVMGREFPRVDFEILRKHSNGLFVTSACGGSPFAAAIFEKNIDKAKETAKMFQEVFGDRFFIELQPHDMQRGDFNQAYLNDMLKSVAEELGIEMVTTCDSHYLTNKHEKYHDMILAISSKKALEDPTRHRYATYQPCIICTGTGIYPEGSKKVCYQCNGTKYSAIKTCPEFYLKDEKIIETHFSQHYGSEFAKKLTSNTVKIADKCEFPDYMEPKGIRIPKFDWRKEEDANQFEGWINNKDSLKHLTDEAQYLRFKVKTAFDEYCKDFDKDKKKLYWDRVVKELEILEAKKFSSYMLIVADFLAWAEKHNILIGPGRGSVSGSLVAFLLKIHCADPIQYNLLFERFQNREKKSAPDIDSDISPSGREAVIEYCRQRYGYDCVAAISNINKLTPKIAIKDIARSLVLGGDKSTAFAIANSITADIPDIIITDTDKRIKVDTLEKAVGASEKLQGFLQKYPIVEEYAKELIGLPRAWSVHAAGIVMSDAPLADFVPLRRDRAGTWITQYDKDLCEEIGLLKMDFLGLDTLDILSETHQLAKAVNITLRKPKEIIDGDPKAYKLISAGYTTGIFQLNGSLTPLCQALKPQSIEDIAIINALGRPASKKDRPEYIKRKEGVSKPKYIHKCLEPVLKATYGMPIYEEDLLRLAQSIAGWDLSEADGLRKLTKLKEKGVELAAQLEKKFVTDVIEHSKVTQAEAQEIWDKVVVPWAGYGFNKSHAIVYSMISYQTAYYKAHATGPFLCANLNAQTRGNKKQKDDLIYTLKKEAKKFKINILSCDINFSKQYYSMKDDKTIVTGLGAIKGIGEKALDAIIKQQPYASIEDFLYRTPANIVNKTVVCALAKAGAFDSLGVSRKYVLENYAEIRKEIAAFAKKFGTEVVETYEDTVEEAIEGTTEDLDEFSDDDSGEVNEKVKTAFKIVVKTKKSYKISPEQLATFTPKCALLSKEEYTMREKMTLEKEVLGEYVSANLSLVYPGFFVEGVYSQPFSKIPSLAKGINFPTEGVVSELRVMKGKSGRNVGKDLAKVTLENLRGETVNIMVWADLYEKVKKNLCVGLPVRLMCKVNDNQGKKELMLVNLEAFYQERAK